MLNNWEFLGIGKGHAWRPLLKSFISCIMHAWEFTDTMATLLMPLIWMYMFGCIALFMLNTEPFSVCL